MAELAISQIIKMTIAVAVMAIIIVGVVLSFTTYIVPYFAGDSEPPKDITTPYYQTLMQPQNFAASVLIKDSSGHSQIMMKGAKRINYYFDGFSEIKTPSGHWWIRDSVVGSVPKETGKIKINSQYISDSDLQILDGAERIGNEIYKIK